MIGPDAYGRPLNLPQAPDPVQMTFGGPRNGEADVGREGQENPQPEATFQCLCLQRTVPSELLPELVAGDRRLLAQNAICFLILCVTVSKISSRISITAVNALLELMSPLSKCNGHDATVDSPSVSGVASVLTSSV